MKKIEVSWYLDSRYAKKTSGGRMCLKLRVAPRKESAKLYSTWYDLTQQEFNRINSRTPGNLKEIKDTLVDIELKCRSLINGMTMFSWYQLERDLIVPDHRFQQNEIKSWPIKEENDEFNFERYFHKFPILTETPSGPFSLLKGYQVLVKENIERKSFGNALNYQDSYYFVSKFFGDVDITSIDANKLIKLEQWGLEIQGINLVTVGVKTRHLRAVFNYYINEGFLSKEFYPFGTRKYVIPQGSRLKKALSLETTRLIHAYSPENPEELMAVHLWLFIYQGNGINPKDLCLLKYRNIQDGYLVFFREKSKNTTRKDPVKIVTYITEDMKMIIQKYGNPNNDPDSYIFPIVSPEVDAYDAYWQIRNFKGRLYRNLQKAARGIGIPKLNTSHARHSLATHLKVHLLAPLEYIKEKLGHADLKTTEIYTKDFLDSTTKNTTIELVELNKIAL